MAAGRKLQAEIEKLCKKVEEGLEEFKNVWDSVHNAQHANQREKFEGELKTQIKKLQRDRDQIKTWLGDKSVKDKNALTDFRKKIEVEMERFKEFERDAKTKTYSKEGLSKSDKVDPHEEERRKHREWIQDAIDKLKVQIDELEAELEAQGASGGSSGKKSKQAKLDESRLAHTRHMQDTHRWHVGKLEQLLRKLDNDEAEFEELEELKDSVDYYVDDNSRDEGDFQTFDSIYENFGLEDVEDYLTKDKIDEEALAEKEAEEAAKKAEEEAKVAEKKEEVKEQKDPSKRKAEAKGASAATSPSLRHQRSNSGKDDDPKKESSGPKLWPPMVSVWQNLPPSVPQAKEPPPPAKPAPPTQTGLSQAPRPAPTLPPPMQPAPERPPPPNQSPVLNTAPNMPPPKPAPHAVPPHGAPPNQPPQLLPPTSAPPQAPPLGSPPRQQGSGIQPTGLMPTGVPLPPGSLVPPPPGAPPPTPQDSSAVSVAGSGSQPFTAPPTMAPPPPPLLPPPPPSHVPTQGVPGVASAAPAMPKEPPASLTAAHSGDQPKVPPPSEAPPPPAESPPPPPPKGAGTSASFDEGDGRGGAPMLDILGGSGGLTLGGLLSPSATAYREGVAEGPRTPSKQHALDLLVSSHQHLPLSSDSRRNRKYMPRSPYVHMDTRNTAAYPTAPTRSYDDPSTFEKYDLDTLFFIFYYQQGSYQQHLAAIELKKLSWRFHTKYLTWFQRHEEPRMTASDFERGAYVYFDHDAGWCQRIKSDFTFEYQFLEDEPSP